MIRIAYWNLCKKPLTELVCDLVRYGNIDVLILSESEGVDSNIPQALKAIRDAYRPVVSDSDHVIAFSALTPREFHAVEVSISRRMCIYRLHLTGQDLLVAALHMPSKMNLSDADQAQLASRYSREIAAVESRFAIPLSVICGDFNMNPFDHGMVSSEGFHAVMSAAIAKRIGRTVDSRRSLFYYNPMWSLLGDRSPGPPGSTYFGASRPINIFWNTFDQVLVRPGLTEVLDEVRIMDRIDSTMLFNASGVPDLRRASDHFPLVFSLNLDRIRQELR